MKYLLDTNAASAIMKGDPRVLERLRSVPREDVGLPQPVAAELAYGIERLSASRRQEHLQARFALILQEIPRISWDDNVSRRFGAIKASLERAGERIEDFDVAIAAHALATDATVVTANFSHLGRIRGLRVEDWGRPRP
ncbi:MAG: type II toxin-antitoxin system VapC family toxin [Planctomycetes bacterium]|nr:type II toxin-antitoxin system VapC family toxin [Planctomycetota bacterium]